MQTGGGGGGGERILSCIAKHKSVVIIASVIWEAVNYIVLHGFSYTVMLLLLQVLFDLLFNGSFCLLYGAPGKCYACI